MARVYREIGDSSGFERPRVLTRVLVEPGRLAVTVRFYEDLAGQPLDTELGVYPTPWTANRRSSAAIPSS